MHRSEGRCVQSLIAAMEAMRAGPSKMGCRSSMPTSARWRPIRNGPVWKVCESRTKTVLRYGGFIRMHVWKCMVYENDLFLHLESQNLWHPLTPTIATAVDHPGTSRFPKIADVDSPHKKVTDVKPSLELLNSIIQGKKMQGPLPWSAWERAATEPVLQIRGRRYAALAEENIWWAQ